VYQRPHFVWRAKAVPVSSLRYPLHAGTPARSDDGIVGGSLCRLLSAPPDAGAEDTVEVAHGGGGRAMAQLLDSVFRPDFANPLLAYQHHGTVFELTGPCTFTTDSFVVKPLFYPGGDVGKLAVYGTVNDLVMCGARPLYLSAAFILEEGLSLGTLQRVVTSMREAAAQVGVQLVTRDLKVVDRGMADGIFINTTGIGHIVAPIPIQPQRVLPGDAVILSGDIGRHGIAVMAGSPRIWP
jgi:hydrogenase expression/formation protein HypE